MTYRRFEPVSEVDVMVDGGMAVLKYRSAIEISVRGEQPLALEAWHLDCYRRSDDGVWQVWWSQATAVS
jgi:ketosteroid isomerase-like protein